MLENKENTSRRLETNQQKNDIPQEMTFYSHREKKFKRTTK